MIQLQVVLKSLSVINPSVTNYNFESVEQGIIFAQNCAVKDSVSVELNSLDEAGQVSECLYSFDAHAVEEVLEPVGDPVVEEVVEVVTVEEAPILEVEEVAPESVGPIAEEAKEEVLEEPTI